MFTVETAACDSTCQERPPRSSFRDQALLQAADEVLIAEIMDDAQPPLLTGPPLARSSLPIARLDTEWSLPELGRPAQPVALR